MVAEWPFCLSCFDNLMKGPLKSREVEQPADIPAAATEAATVRCSVCKGQFPPEIVRTLSFWTFCPQCYEEPASLAGMENQEGETSPDPADSAASTEDIPEGGGAEMTVGLAKYINCRGCGRRIPQGGSRSIEGEHFCPDCYYRMSQELERGQTAKPPPLGERQAAEMEPPPEISSREGGDRCACCDRPLRPGLYEEMEGFTLCRACLSTDSALAVKIARDRHRRLLDRIREDLGAPKPL